MVHVTRNNITDYNGTEARLAQVQSVKQAREIIKHKSCMKVPLNHVQQFLAQVHVLLMHRHARKRASCTKQFCSISANQMQQPISLLLLHSWQACRARSHHFELDFFPVDLGG
jgi:SH3-like domain-containing protein